jgi:hypoxanthine phosphoribosyltransferase
VKVHYRSTVQLANTIKNKLCNMRDQVDLVVGIPRSGLLAGFFASEALRRPMTDLVGLREGRILFPVPGPMPAPLQGRLRVLVIDDSVNSGISLQQVRERLSDLSDRIEVTVCAVYGPRRRCRHVDMVLEKVGNPHVFEWNALHHDLLADATVDLDEVIMGDDTAADPRLFRAPTKPIGFALTTLPAARHPATMKMLQGRGVEIGQLVHVHAASAAELAAAKADAFCGLPSTFYLARTAATASVVAAQSGKPALSLDTQRMHRPIPRSSRQLAAAAQGRYLELLAMQSPLVSSWYWKQRARRLAGDDVYLTLKRLTGR